MVVEIGLGSVVVDEKRGNAKIEGGVEGPRRKAVGHVQTGSGGGDIGTECVRRVNDRDLDGVKGNGEREIEGLRVDVERRRVERKEIAKQPSEKIESCDSSDSDSDQFNWTITNK